MSQYVKVLQHNGGFISLLADDDGVIQYTTNDADYSGLVGSTPADSITTAMVQDGAITTDKLASGAAATSIFVPQTATLIAATDTVTFTGLDGNAKGDIEISGNIVCPATGTPSYYFRPNGTNEGFSILTVTSSAAATVDPVDIPTAMALGGISGAAGAYRQIIIRFCAKSGKARQFTAKVTDKTGSTRRSIMSDGGWANTSTNVTSAVLFSDDANGFGIGTRLVCRYLGVSS